MNKREIEIARLAYSAGICMERERPVWKMEEPAMIMANDWVDDANATNGWWMFEELLEYPDAGPIKGMIYAAPVGIAILLFTLWALLT